MRASAPTGRDTVATVHPVVADAEPAEPAPHAQVVAGRYEVCAPLGFGGMGEVLLADDLLLARPVAIKRCRTPTLDESYRRKLRREARIGARIAHRAVAQVYDLVEEAGVDYLVMELVDGPTLYDIHEAGRMPPAEVVRIATELAGGLAAIHASNTVHLDVKLENVLLTKDGQPKLVDFGIAQCADEVDVDADADAHQLFGTPRTMSPEQIRRRQVDGRSDLFSLGVLLFELLAGVSPFDAATEVGSMARVLRETPPRIDTLVPEVPSDLAGLVTDLLEKKPTRRPQSAVEVQIRLWSISLASTRRCLG